MAKAKKLEVLRWYKLGNNHERIILREEIREVMQPSCGERRISEADMAEDDNGDQEEINLNAIAAQLPPELEGQWIVTVVRSFGEFRGVHNDSALRDIFNEAVAVAFRAVGEAQAVGGDVTAFVKQAVRFRLIDLQRQEDYRDARLENDDTKVMVRNPFGDLRSVLLLLSDDVVRLWHAYRRSRGVMSEFAAQLGVSDYLATTKYFPLLKDEFREALAWVRVIRGKRF